MRLPAHDLRLEYCVQGDTLTMRSAESEITLIYDRAALSLPFTPTGLEPVQGAPSPALELVLDSGDCGPRVTLDTDAGTIGCGAGRYRVASVGTDASSVFFMRGLVIPSGAVLEIQGSRPARIIADHIEVEGSIEFLPTPGGSVHAGATGTDAGGGGGGHCTAGGRGTALGDSFITGGIVFGSFEALTFGGDGGEAVANNSGETAAGGLGGGALHLIAATGIRVSGSIAANGASGGETRLNNLGAGGGAGGSIFLEAPSVTIEAGAIISAVGARGAGYYGGSGSLGMGAGEDGSGEGASFQSGGGGGSGRVMINTAPGGATLAGTIQPGSGLCRHLGSLLGYPTSS